MNNNFNHMSVDVVLGTNCQGFFLYMHTLDDCHLCLHVYISLHQLTL